MSNNDEIFQKIIKGIRKIICNAKIRTNKIVTSSVIEYVFFLGCMLSAGLMVYRLFFGTEFTDEAYTVSDVLAVMHGNIPYTDDTVIAAGQVFVPLFLYRIYEIIIPSLEGIFLFSRITFTLFRFCVIVIICRYLIDKIERKWRLLIVGILIVYSGTIPNWGYNGTSMVLVLLTEFLLYYVLHKANKGISLYFGIAMCGFISGLTVFTHPAYATMVIANVIIIFIVSNNRMKCVLFYCVGGIVNIVVCIVPIIIKSGIGRFIYGLESCFITAPDNFIKTTVIDRTKEVIAIGIQWWGLILVLSTVLFYLATRYMRIDEHKLSKREYWLLSVSVSVLVCSVLAVYKGFDFSQVAGVLCVMAFLLLIPTYEGAGSLAWFFGIYNIMFIVVLIISSQTGNRFYYCIPMVIPILIDLFKTEHRLFHEIGAVLAILLIVLIGRYDFKYIYRDDSFRNLTARVESGVYKGIYTTPDRANDVVELEKYINDNISSDEVVSFRDNAPVAYLMRNKNICDVRTWDIMQYSYGCNDPTLMYRYYKNKKQIPDVIAYIDFGRDEILSIEKSEDDFQFNKFVNDYYYLDKDDFSNNTFRVLIYRNNGKFDDDFDGLLDSVVN
ncbi:MAG: hypothetical protein J5802_14785 [Butyrivibrio sp.]|nr:hypothetical protein [Butyrivibrio sp.]